MERQKIRGLRISLPCNLVQIRYLAKLVFYSDVTVVPNSSPLGIEHFDFDISHLSATNQKQSETTN